MKRIVLEWVCLLPLLASSLAWSKSTNLKSSAPSLYTPVSYSDFVRLPRSLQENYIKAIRAVILEASPQTAQQTSELDDFWAERVATWTIDKMICEAVAADDDVENSFCINLGVIKSHDDCVGQDPWHTFDTVAAMPRAFAAAEKGCDAGKQELPCSPFFGFTSDGQLHCASTNLTRTCDQLSKRPGGKSFVDVIQACAQKTQPAPVLDCDAIPQFYQQQDQYATNLCTQTRPRLACGILRTQIAKVKEAITEANGKLSPDDVRQIASYLGSASSPDSSAQSPCVAASTSTSTGAQASAPSTSTGTSGTPATPADQTMTVTTTATTTSLSASPTSADPSTAPKEKRHRGGKNQPEEGDPPRLTGVTDTISVAASNQGTASSGAPFSGAGAVADTGGVAGTGQMAPSLNARPSAPAQAGGVPQPGAGQSVPAPDPIPFVSQSCRRVSLSPGDSQFFGDIQTKLLPPGASDGCVSTLLPDGTMVTLANEHGELMGAKIQAPAKNGVFPPEVELDEQHTIIMAAASGYVASKSFAAAKIPANNIFPYYIPATNILISPTPLLGEQGNPLPATKQYMTANGTIVRFSDTFIGDPHAPTGFLKVEITVPGMSPVSAYAPYPNENVAH